MKKIIYLSTCKFVTWASQDEQTNSIEGFIGNDVLISEKK